MSNTDSGGRPIAALPLNMTIGRSISLGEISIAQIRASSVKDKLVRFWSLNIQ
jgi:hypothetical protein